MNHGMVKTRRLKNVMIRIRISTLLVPAKYQVFQVVGILLEISSISNSMRDKSCVSKYLIQNAGFCHRNPRFSIEILGFSSEILGI